MDARRRLEAVLRGIGPLAVAVSGGVDSMTLAVLAQRVLGRDARMVHAVSPAVPEEASARVREHARREGWRLDLIDAGEFADPNYLANPHNRCFFCKRNLYATMSATVDCVLVSGTNSDDLSDYRPGLQAAADHGVRHPYVEARIDKAGVRALARALALHDLAELPASPCLSSRIETGIGIDPVALGAVERVERLVREALAAATVRCRIRSNAVVVELDAESLAALDASTTHRLERRIRGLVAAAGIDQPVSFRRYRMGSTFLRPAHDR
jgi:uncharacterized protein